MNSREAFIKADRARRASHPVSLEQRQRLKRLSLKAGVEMPRVFSSAQATAAITSLEAILRPPAQPMLEGFEVGQV
jgi:hypothetical protein